MIVKDFGMVYQGDWIVELRCKHGNSCIAMCGQGFGEGVFEGLNGAPRAFLRSALLKASVSKIYTMNNGCMPRVVVNF